MDIELFYEQFITLLDNLKDEYELESRHDALILWFGENSINLESAEVKNRIFTDSYAEGIDAVLLDEQNLTFYFIQAKTVNQFSNTGSNLSEIDVKSTLSGTKFLLKGNYKGKITPVLENLVDEYHELVKTFRYQTVVLFLIMMKDPTDFKFVEEFKKEFPQVNINFFNIDWIHDFYENTFLASEDPAPENITFEVLTNYLNKDEPIKSRVFSTKAKELARIYDENKQRIFQKNVRASLGLKSKSINRQIRDTAIDEQRRSKFWYFNNGITIICQEISETPSGSLIKLKKPLIINGAQTTYALHAAYSDGKLEEEVEVLIKAIESDEKDFIENVTLYTNSQNAIRLRDLCSNDTIQIKLQTLTESLFKYFYERKRGEFDSLYPTVEAKKSKLGEDYKQKIVSNENAAQAYLALYLDKPSQAKAEKRRIFSKDEGFYDNIFNDSIDILAEKIFLSWLLLKFIESEKKKYYKQYKEAEQLPEEEQESIYCYDFLFHSEYFILNLFKDFLKNSSLNIGINREHIIKAISLIQTNHSSISSLHEQIKELLKEFIDSMKSRPGYYHNKFFKSEKSIGLIRSFLNNKFDFVDVINI